MSSRQKRKRKRRAAGAGAAPAGRAPSRSEQKNEAARAALVPLERGERPRAVTVGAVVAGLLGASNLALYIAGVDIRGQDANAGALLFGALMLAAAWGMWTVRYWAVLGMQALLGLIIIVFSLFAMTAASVWALLLALAIVGAAGTLFWFMVKAMARIQMPTRDQ
jgi:hypothetical protein